MPPTLAISDASLAFSVQCDTTAALSADDIYGGVGRDVLFGGRGGDRLSLGTEANRTDTSGAGDVLIGDSGLVQFGPTTVAGATRVVTRVVSSFAVLSGTGSVIFTA